MGNAERSAQRPSPAAGRRLATLGHETAGHRPHCHHPYHSRLALRLHPSVHRGTPLPLYLAHLKDSVTCSRVLSSVV